MKRRLSVTLAVVTCLAVLTLCQPAGAQDQPPAAICSAPSALLPFGSGPVPVQGCNFCTGEDFCPQSGVRCSFLGTCAKGGNRCCNYGCECDPTCTTVSQPDQVCSYQVPTCPTCPRRTFCQVSYCGGEGIRCTHNGTCGPGGCCNYDCGVDLTCTLPDPLPPNAC